MLGLAVFLVPKTLLMDDRPKIIAQHQPSSISHRRDRCQVSLECAEEDAEGDEIDPDEDEDGERRRRRRKRKKGPFRSGQATGDTFCYFRIEGGELDSILLMLDKS